MSAEDPADPRHCAARETPSKARGDPLRVPDPLARELRQNSPFLGILPDDERLAVLEAFRAAGRAARRPGAGAAR
jgi:hypothetical protein